MGWLLQIMIALAIFVPAILVLVYTASASQSRFRREMDRLAAAADEQRRNLERQEAVLDRAEPSEPIDDAIRIRE